MRSYEIRLTTPGFDGAVKNMDAMGRSMKRIDDRLNKIASSASGLDAVTRRMEKLADALDRVASGQAAITGNKQGVSGGGGRAGGGGRRSGFLSGPNQRLETIAQQMPQAVLQNNIPAIADLERAKRLAERSIALDSRRKDDPEHLSRPGLLELFSEMNGLLGKLSRGDVFGITGKIIQLGGGRNTAGGVNMQQMAAYGLPSAMKAQDAAASGVMGRLAPLAGRAVALAASPIGIAVGVAAAGIITMGAAASAAARMLGTISGAAASSGASPGEIAALRAMGIDPGSATGLGAGLRSRMSSDPWAIASGGYASPSHLTGQSDAPLIQKQMERLHALYSEGRAQDAVLHARRLGIESLLDEAMVSNRVWKERAKDAEAAKKIYSPAMTQAARDFAAQQARISQQWDDMKAVFGGRYMENFSEIMSEIANAMRAVNGTGNALKPILDFLIDMQMFGGGIAFSRVFDKMLGNTTNTGKTPIDKNTAALEELAKVLKDVVGAGPRARGALSPGQKAAIQRGMDWDTARNLGAFRL